MGNLKSRRRFPAQMHRLRTSDHGCPQISRKKHETNRKKDLKLLKNHEKWENAKKCLKVGKTHAKIYLRDILSNSLLLVRQGARDQKEVKAT